MKESIKEAKEALQFYNKHAKIYAEHTSEKLMQFQLNHFISLLPKKAKVLDLGCGAGRDSQYFKEDGFEVVGIDISDNMLKEAKVRAPDVTFKKMDMKKLEFPDDYFDGVWIMATLHTVEKKDAMQSLKEAARVLKKDGVLYVAVKEGTGEIVKQNPKYGNVPKFYAYYQQPEMEDLIKQAGFTITKSTVELDSASSQTWVEIFAKVSS